AGARSRIWQRGRRGRPLLGRGPAQEFACAARPHAVAAGADGHAPAPGRCGLPGRTLNSLAQPQGWPSHGAAPSVDGEDDTLNPGAGMTTIEEPVASFIDAVNRHDEDAFLAS